jgi:hypothetical protein
MDLRPSTELASVVGQDYFRDPQGFIEGRPIIDRSYAVIGIFEL